MGNINLITCSLNDCYLDMRFKKSFKYILIILTLIHSPFFQVLAIDENNVKALFRKGQANAFLCNYELALKLFNRANRLCPKDKKILSEIRKVKQSIKDYLTIEKATYAKMFNKT